MSLERQDPIEPERIENSAEGEAHRTPCPNSFCVHLLSETGECRLARSLRATLSQSGRYEQEVKRSHPDFNPHDLWSLRVPTHCSFNPLCSQRAATPDEILLKPEKRPSHIQVERESQKWSQQLFSNDSPEKQLLDKLNRALAPLFSLPDFGPFKGLRLSFSLKTSEKHDGPFHSNLIPFINLSGTF